MLKRGAPGDGIAPLIKAQFAQNLRSLRMQSKQSQEAFARAHGFDRAYISRLERELSVPTLEIVARLALALDVTIALLTQGIEDGVRQAIRDGILADHSAQPSRATTRPYMGPTPRKDVAYLKQLGDKAQLTLTSKRYLGASRVHRWSCSQGHEVRMTTGNLRQRLEKGLISCVRCSQIERAELLSAQEEERVPEKESIQCHSVRRYEFLVAPPPFDSHGM